ncbi:MAG: hypothetical protein JWR20_1491 [Marmoricola sp.]|nr:hypothetical protein [Marmoricola sp.]
MSGRTRVRLLAVVVLLVGLAFVQDPGYLVPDTKFDLAVSPGEFLQRALHLWDDRGAFGQLQNQAYGYLWPMGPFFTLFHALDVPGWAVQRLWQALVLCVAFLGAARLARALGTRSDVTLVVAGLAYALSPRMLTVLGPISIEAWPSALAPWVLLPLVRGSTSGSPRRAAALSALAVAMVGGVNAAATFAVLPLGAVWLLTRQRGPRRTAMLVWWPVFTLLGTLWWLVPLFVMGAYSPPFLDFIETTTVTTFPTTLFDALRGTSNWVPYVSGDSRAGNDLLITGVLALQSGLVLMAGLAGLLDRRNPHRLFLTLGVVVGLVMVTAGHLGEVQGVFAGQLHGLLDGALAPLRNVHKFDPVLRLPLVLGLAFALDHVLARRAAVAAGSTSLQSRLSGVNRAVLAGLVVLGVVGAATPALAGRLESAGRIASVPGYWTDAARWLGAHDHTGSALLAPGSSFGDYLWGTPRDEPLQFLASSPWSVRNAIPLAPTGNIRVLDAIEDRFAQGEGSPGMAAFLRRSGVGHLVVRNDLRPGGDVPDPVLVHQAIADSPGLTRVATFGPSVGGGASLTRRGLRTVVNDGWQTRYPAVEVFRVQGTADARTGGVPTVVAGGPEDLLDLADLGLLGTDPTVLASDVRRGSGLPAAPAGFVLTDGLRDRVRFFPRVHDGYSPVRTSGDGLRTDSPRRDYVDPGQDRWATRAVLEGARSLSASSSASDPDAPGGSRRGELPYAAVDGSPTTSWAPASDQGGRTWWRVGLDAPTVVGQVSVLAGPDARDNQELRVRTAAGVSRVRSVDAGERVVLDVPPGPTTWIRVESASTSGSALSLAEVGWPGRSVVRRLVLPTAPRSWGDPSAIVLRADLDARRGCAVVEGAVRCAPDRDRTSEEDAGFDRRFTLPGAQDLTPSLRVRPRAGAALDDLVQGRQPVTVSATSVGTSDPRGSAVAAIDGDPATTWIARTGDFRPALQLNWIGRRTIRGISLATATQTAARRPTQVTLVWPGGRREVSLGADGRARFPAFRASQVRIQVDEASFATGLDFAARQTQLPVGVTELRLNGLPYVPTVVSTQAVDQGCGTGPAVTVDGVLRPTTVVASAAQLLSGADLTAELCTNGAGDARSAAAGDSPLALGAGSHDVSVRGSSAFDAVSLVLADPAAATPSSAGEQQVRAGSSSPVRREVDPAGEDARVLDLQQNQNPGWQARQGDRRLAPVVLDGWQQGWFLRSSSAPVRATFAPDTTYRVGLGAGLLCLFLLVGLVLGPLRRERRDGPAPVGAASASVLLTSGLAVAAAVVLAGWPGAVVAVLALALARVVDRRAPGVLPWAFGAAAVVAAAGYLVHPWAHPSGWAGDSAWPHYLVLVPVVVGLALAGDRSARWRGPSPRSRRAGSSTRR